MPYCHVTLGLLAKVVKRPISPLIIALSINLGIPSGPVMGQSNAKVTKAVDVQLTIEEYITITPQGQTIYFIVTEGMIHSNYDDLMDASRGITVESNHPGELLCLRTLVLKDASDANSPYSIKGTVAFEGTGNPNQRPYPDNNGEMHSVLPVGHGITSNIRIQVILPAPQGGWSYQDVAGIYKETVVVFWVPGS